MFSLPSLRLGRFILAFVFAITAQAQTVVRVLHYNIHRDIGGTDSNVASQPALAKVVNYLAPDVWAINELGGNSAGYSAATARTTLIAFINANLTIFGPSPVEGQDYFIYIGTLTDGYITQAIVSRYPFLSTQTYSDAGGGFPVLRGLVSARVNIPGPVELGVFTAHLKAFNSTTEASKRQAEAAADAATLQTWLASHPGDGAVMTGDLNETEEPGDVDNWASGAIGDLLPNGSVYQPITTLRNAGLADAAPVSIAGNRDTIDATSPDARFDYVLHRASHLIYLSGSVFDTKQHTAAQLAALNAASGTSFAAGDSAAASDHLPVLEVFLATPGAPYIAAQSASGLASTATTLNATINSNGFATTWRIELGTTTAYGASSVSSALGAGTSQANVSLAVAGLAPGTTYHFRFVTENSAGTSTGPDRTFTTAAFLDSDGDGLPNDWEAANGLNANLASDATLDRDGDGVSNRDEFAAGTDPRDHASLLRIQSFARLGADIVVSWPSVFGRRYELQMRAGIASGPWSALQSNLTGTGATISATDSGAAPPLAQRFYRVVALP